MTSTTEPRLTEEDTATGEQPPKKAKTSKGTATNGWNNRKIWVFLAVLLEVGLLVVVSWYVRHPSLWQFVTAWLPAVLILYHALNLWRQRPIPPSDADLTPEAARVAQRIWDEYGWDAIVSRYILPALLLPIVGMVAFRIVMDRSLLNLTFDHHLAFEYGLVGAYFFVFLELGKRSVRNDITPVSIIWCLITLTVGPTLALLIPSVFPQSLKGSWSDRALWVFAGYAPRLLFEKLLQESISRSLHINTPVVREERQIPLGKIQGIGVDEINRLAEEGVTDVHALACADPVRLMRDTRFDNERILSWMDQALLVISVPEEVRQQLLRRGYQRATDVEDLITRRAGDSSWHLLTDVEANKILGEVAKAAGVEQAEVRDMLARLVENPKIKEFLELRSLLAGRSEQPPPKEDEKEVRSQEPTGKGPGKAPQNVSEEPAGSIDEEPKVQPPEKADAAKKGG